MNPKAGCWRKFSCLKNVSAPGFMKRQPSTFKTCLPGLSRRLFLKHLGAVGALGSALANDSETGRSRVHRTAQTELDMTLVGQSKPGNVVLGLIHETSS